MRRLSTLLLLLAACGDDAPSTTDAGPRADAGGASSDASLGGPDAGAPGADAGPPLGTGAVETATIGAAGGSLSLEALTLTIPAGALAGDTPISIVSLPLPPRASVPGAARTPVYVLTPEGQTFAQPITVSLALDAPSAQDRVLWSDASFELMPVATTIRGDSIEATGTHFSCVMGGHGQYVCPLPRVTGSSPNSARVGDRVRVVGNLLRIHEPNLRVFIGGGAAGSLVTETNTLGSEGYIVVPPGSMTGAFTVRVQGIPGWSVSGGRINILP